MKKAFTLSEVMLVLSVIGVIAALTIPGIIQSTNDKQTVAKLKKTYSVLSQATTMVDEDGAWDFVSSDNMTNVYAAKMNLLKVDIQANVFPHVWYKNGAGADQWNMSSYATRRSAVLSDGTLAFFTSESNCSRISGALSNICGYIYVDINGATGPNQIARDFFPFWIVKNSGGNLSLIPIGNNDAYGTCSSSNINESCTNYVLINNKLP